MKMRFLAVLMCGAMVLAAAPAVLAAETMTEAEDAWDEAGEEEGLMGLIGSLSGEDGEFSGLLGEVTDDDDEWDYEDYEDEEVVDAEAEEAIKAFIMSQNAEFMEEGDYNIVTPVYVTEELLEDGSIRVLGEFSQENFTQEDTDLKMVSGASSPWLLTLEKDEDDAWVVTESATTEDGEGYADSLAVLCEEVGLTTDDYFSMTEFKELYVLTAYSDLLEQTDGIERIEYAGEMLTSQDLDERIEDMIGEIFDMMFEYILEDMTEDMTE